MKIRTRVSVFALAAFLAGGCYGGTHVQRDAGSASRVVHGYLPPTAPVQGRFSTAPSVADSQLLVR